MVKSVKANYAFNLLNTISGLLFPLLTFPYASRIMMADGIGHVNFYQSIISYISLLSCIGIPMYAVREIAKVRNDKERIHKAHCASERRKSIPKISVNKSIVSNVSN